MTTVEDLDRRLGLLERDTSLRQVKQSLAGLRPTGGDNADGEFVIVGGLLICRHRLLVSANPTTWTYPHPYDDTPRVSATPLTTAARLATIVSPGGGDVDVRVFNLSGSHVSTNCEMIAVGAPA